MAFCSMCGKSIDDTATFCPYCGSKTDAASTAPAIPQESYGYTPSYTPEAPKNSWSASVDPKAREAAQKASQAATQTVSGVVDAYKKVFSVLSKKPVTLWGISLLCNLLSILAVVLSWIPIIWIPITLVLTLGMSSVYLSGLHGEEVRSDSLFVPFKSFFKNAGGMGWRWLWNFIWSLLLSIIASITISICITCAARLAISHYIGVFSTLGSLVGLILSGLVLIAAIIFTAYKIYSYLFVPYILLSEPEISGTEALRRSKELTRGWKLKIFASEILAIILCAIVGAILFGLVRLTGGFFLFNILLGLFALVVALFSSLFFGLLHCAFYDMASK